jgi:hypothetical protein
MTMPNDPYQIEDRFTLAGVASNAFAVTPNDSADLPVGVKAVDITNRGSAFQSVDMVPVNALPGTRAVTFWVPPNSVRPVPLRVQRVRATGIGADITVIAYTDGNSIAGDI